MQNRRTPWFLFATSLVENRVPLCTRIAALAHDPIEPKLGRYTRQVTVAWMIFFASNVCISAVLFAYAPIVVWSVYANVLDLPLVGLMFVAEYGMRHWLLPDMKHVSIFDSMRRYVHLSRTSPPPAA